VKHCKKCSAGEVRVKIMSNGFCQECEFERAWNNKAEEKRQRDMIARMQMRKRVADKVNRAWKEKYGDASPEEVASYR
tara:strand:- start:531 stop:764 length:234 start_codon:yes stop_codon:yes gene_type:complete